MGFRAAKISFDGSHYIATPKENFPRGKKRRRSSHPASEQETERKDQFETAYKESQKLPKKERKEYIKKAMEQAISDEEQRQEFVERNSERKKINAIRRKVRLSKKANLQTWNFFCTFTYSDDKHTEESFRKSLRNTLKHLVNRKGWKHIGVWERRGDTNRLHFHGIFYIPPNGMVGEIIETKDYSTKDNRMQTASQNTYFLERYGRNDFQKLILRHEVGDSLKYLMKYIKKSGERLVYGGKLPSYFESDVLDEDIIVPYGIDDRKAVLADDFLCMVDGEVIGRVSSEVIEKICVFHLFHLQLYEGDVIVHLPVIFICDVPICISFQARVWLAFIEIIFFRIDFCEICATIAATKRQNLESLFSFNNDAEVIDGKK